jgi:hypothetical protein
VPAWWRAGRADTRGAAQMSSVFQNVRACVYQCLSVAIYFEPATRVNASSIAKLE